MIPESLIQNPSVLTRIFVGKMIGLALGVSALLFIWVADLTVPVRMQVGMLFWYVLIGAFIGFMGVITRIGVVIDLPLPWWLRGSVVAINMNVALVLFASPGLAAVVSQMCPAIADFWTMLILAMLEGIAVGLLIDYFATRIGGEGVSTVTADTQAS